MLGAVVGISQLQLLPSLDFQQWQGGSQQDGWRRAAVFQPLVKDFSLLKALEEEGKKLCVETHFCCTSGAAAHPSPRAM